MENEEIQILPIDEFWWTIAWFRNVPIFAIPDPNSQTSSASFIKVLFILVPMYSSMPFDEKFVLD